MVNNLLCILYRYYEHCENVRSTVIYFRVTSKKHNRFYKILDLRIKILVISLIIFFPIIKNLLGIFYF